MPEAKLSFAEHYHERTKYAPKTLASKSQGLDWSTQPSPYKDYKIGTVYDLKPYLTEEVQSDRDGLLASRWRRLSRLLFCSYGLTARVPTISGEAFYLRSAPSAGGLYPAEVYLISAGTPLLSAGIYNYQVRSHSLIHFWQDNHVWSGLQKACFGHPALQDSRLAIAITSVFYRSAWRYQDRAYRRIFLDTGHLLGNIELSSSIEDYQASLIGGFADEAINELLFLDKQVEGAIAIVPIVDLQDEERIGRGQESRSPLQRSANLAKGLMTALPSTTVTSYPKLADGELLGFLHQSTQISEQPNMPNMWQQLKDNQPETQNPNAEQDLDKYNFPFCTKVSTVTDSIHWGDELEMLENTILQRRSTREYSGGKLELAELKAILDFTYQPQHYTDQGIDGHPDYFDLSLIETFVAVTGVVGLEVGCYYYAPKSQELRQIRFKNFRDELHYLCLGQELGRDAGAVVFHTADLQKAVEKYGDRVYRYLHMDAGHLGQRINLAAIGLGVGVSGIAGFFDDLVNEVLGIPNDEAVLYITTLGRPR
ncbi:SagB/ThcOx family dehydrogenase [Pseudanabaena sp. FACHB-1998]|uniref:SagB/ThcOx family dehydrogenase n=1 Tax=Pseudanabaena sp. FACHB-1998 TaxID=2692858 RepID=UPI001681037B|nr:SagB/ThcOx family dehydrogenase [Pseudanabaena sp. FACHB-1998]MBD2175368.1 SagB/ThcOx family dehydrogenase [Pseudanabaena sp. FACHB-1998]